MAGKPPLKRAPSRRRKYDAIVSTVGGQPTPVLIPYFECDFKRAVLILTDAVRREAEQLEKALEKRAGKTKIELVLTDPYSFAKIRLDLNKSLGAGKGRKILCNFTGGTKPMSIQLKKWAERHPCDSCYVSTEDGTVYWFSRGKTREVPIRARFSIREYLEAHGYGVEESAPFLFKPESRKRHKIRYDFYLSIIKGKIKGNKYCFLIQKGQDQRLGKINKRRPEKEILACRPVPGGDLVMEVEVGLEDLDTLNDLSGGGFWLEDFVYKQLVAAGKNKLFDDCMVRGKVRKNYIENEIDVMVMKQYKLGIISCKSTRLLMKDIDEILSRAGFLGKYTAKFLVTSRDIAQGIRKRAAETGVLLVDNQHLAGIGKFVSEKMSENIPGL